MKIYRIATLLIVLALGINSLPQAFAISDDDKSTLKVKKSKTSKEFKGVRITVTPVYDLLLNDLEEGQIAHDETYAIKTKDQARVECGDTENMTFNKCIDNEKCIPIVEAHISVCTDW